MKINILQFKKLLNILSVQLISQKLKNKFDNKNNSEISIVLHIVVQNFDPHPNFQNNGPVTGKSSVIDCNSFRLLNNCRKKIK